jgi:hypothetical protein
MEVNDIKNRINEINNNLYSAPPHTQHQIRDLIALIEQLIPYQAQLEELKKYWKEDGKHLDYCIECKAPVNHKHIMHGNGQGYHKVVCSVCGGDLIDYFCIAENILYPDETSPINENTPV